jgi:hypothetical protein
VHHDRHAVCGKLDVDLDEVRPVLMRQLDTCNRVLRRESRAAAMADRDGVGA